MRCFRKGVRFREYSDWEENTRQKTCHLACRKNHMLTIRDHLPARNCQGLHRRDFLRIGTLGLGGLSLADLLKVRAIASSSEARDRSVVLLFLHGGPPQHETFDPKMDVGEEYRSAFGEIQTSLPGVSFGSTFPKLAAMAEKLAIVRSFASRNGGHEYTAVASGGNGSKATMSAVYASLAGTMSPHGLPRNVVVFPEAVKEGLKLGSNFETSALPTLTAAGSLGSQNEAFNPVGGTHLKKSMELRMSREQFDDRKALLASVDNLRRDIDSQQAIEREDKFHQQAFEVITRGIGQVFDLAKEDPKTIERYDTSKLFTLEEVTKWYDMKRASNLLGKQMLMARRLVEAGCGFVTVSDCGWDMHSNENSPKNLASVKWLGGQVDHAVSAFLEDLEQRGLSDKVLLIVTGEMGRTPRRNKGGGRDHWGELTPLLLAGGGLKMGQVIGRSDKQGSRPVSEQYTPANLYSTVMNYLFDVPKLRLRTDLSREVKAAIETGTPIGGLV